MSPVNKRPGPQQEKYLRKRRELFRGDVYVIELDRLRGGQRSPLEIAPSDAAYYIARGRAHNRPTIDVWTIRSKIGGRRSLVRELIPTQTL